MKTREEILFELVDNYSGNSMGVHDVGDEYPITQGDGKYRVYHSDGYCFEVIKEQEYDEYNNKSGIYFEFLTGIHDGFKDLYIEDAIKLF